MTRESPAQTGPQARLAEQLPDCQGVPSPQETTVPAPPPPVVERTGPWAPADTGQPPTPAPLVIAGRYEVGPEIAHGGMGPCTGRPTVCSAGRSPSSWFAR